MLGTLIGKGATLLAFATVTTVIAFAFGLTVAVLLDVVVVGGYTLLRKLGV